MIFGNLCYFILFLFTFPSIPTFLESNLYITKLYYKHKNRQYSPQMGVAQENDFLEGTAFLLKCKIIFKIHLYSSIILR